MLQKIWATHMILFGLFSLSPLLQFRVTRHYCRKEQKVFGLFGDAILGSFNDFDSLWRFSIQVGLVGGARVWDHLDGGLGGVLVQSQGIE